MSTRPRAHRDALERSQLVYLGLESRRDSDNGLAFMNKKRAPTEADAPPEKTLAGTKGQQVITRRFKL